jgi:hypothetical protein
MLVLTIAACSRGETAVERRSARTTRSATSEPCAAYAAMMSKRLASSIGDTNPQGRFVEAEHRAELAKGLGAMCDEGVVPETHAMCVQMSDTIDEADRCPLFEPERSAVTKRLSAMVLAAVDVVFALPASAMECDALAAVIYLQMSGVMAETAPDFPMPAPAELAALCTRHRWDASYARCYVATQDNTLCRASSTVGDDVKKLMAEAAGITP